MSASRNEDLRTTLQTAVQLHQAGEWIEATRLYRAVLQAAPLHPDALRCFGVLQAVRGNYGDAETCFRQALTQAPDDAATINNLAGVLRNTGRLAEANQLVRDALDRILGDAELHITLGNVELGQGNFADAEEQFRLAIALAPNSAAAHVGLGATLIKRRKFAAAEQSLRTTLTLDPNNVVAHNNLGCIFSEGGDNATAEQMFRRALELEPRDAAARCNFGRWLLDRKNLAEAEIELTLALRLDPFLSEAHQNLGSLRWEQGRHAEALTSLERAAQLNPKNFDAIKSRGLLLLTLGDFERGFADFELRLDSGEFADVFPSSAGPRWKGEPLAGRTIVICSEQGIGDTLQFVRYGRCLQERGAHVIAAVPTKLHELLRTCPGLDRVVSKSEPLPPHDYCAAMMSLPWLVAKADRTAQAELDSTHAPQAPLTIDFAPQVPYLFANPALVATWKEKLAPYSGLRVGIHWQGRSTYRFDAYRSMPLCAFEPLAKLAGVRLFSLQKGEGVEQLAEWGERLGIVDLAPGLDEKTGAFVETAAVLCNLDLLISNDSAIAHLAGALGVRVWLPIGPVPDWRRFLVREDCPWYPTNRLFRETAYRDWSRSFARMATQLALELKGIPS